LSASNYPPSDGISGDEITFDDKPVGTRLEMRVHRRLPGHMLRYYVRLNRNGQPSFLTRHDDPHHTPISLHDLPGKLRSLVVRIYGEFAAAGSDLSRPASALRGPVVIEWPDGQV
jgi:hypothetical protein